MAFLDAYPRIDLNGTEDTETVESSSLSERHFPRRIR